MNINLVLLFNFIYKDFLLKETTKPTNEKVLDVSLIKNKSDNNIAEINEENDLKEKLMHMTIINLRERYSC